MKRILGAQSGESDRFHDAVREAATIRAVIHRTESGLLIELSNGRSCTVSRDAFGPAEDVMEAAMRWARRNGATSIEIAD